MLAALQQIVQKVNAAANLHEAVQIIVHQVKGAMNVDVCSVYVRDSDAGSYVLKATEGLNPSSVGKIRMAAGEGIVGLVALRQEPMNLANAATHPSYRYFPETGEQQFAGFLAVPLVHFRQSMGVLVVQQRAQRVFADEEVAFLVTVGAQLAASLSYAALGSVIAPLEPVSAGPVGLIQGLPGAAGVAMGTIVLPSPLADLDAVPDRAPENIVLEEENFRRAVRETQKGLRASADRMEGRLSDETRAIFDVYILILGQDDLVEDVLARIRNGNWAPAALRDTIAEHARAFEAAEDPYLRARAEDLRGIGRRILLRLMSGAPTARVYPNDAVLVGEEVSLARVADVPFGQLRGIVCLRGSVVSHTAVLARGLGVPAVMGIGPRDMRALDGHSIIVDGYRGRIFIDPSSVVVQEYRRFIEHERQLSTKLAGLRDSKATTIDGVNVRLGLNVGLLSDVEIAANLGVDEVGLYRSEFPFMSRETFPMEEEQYETYRRLLQAFAPRPVVMRTLDVGGDKPLPYFPIAEENPFLGWRGVRLTLDRPDIFLPQLRAMLRATVPSALLSIFALSRYADFFSIGTNDLTQYLLAVDRNNPNVARLYNHLDPAVVRALYHLIRASRRCKRPMSICGEMAADPGAAILLLGMGLETFSMSAPGIPRIKWLIRSFSAQRAKQILNRAMQMESADSVRKMLDEELVRFGLGELVVNDTYAAGYGRPTEIHGTVATMSSPIAGATK